MTNLNSISHIVINVADLITSKAWYTTSFNCEVVFEDSKSVRLRFENVDLILTLPSMERHHVAYIKDDAETFGELLFKSDGRKSCYIADPTGNPVELVKCE